MVRERRNGFTLLEVLLAIAILATTATVTLFTFSVVAKAWRRGMALTDRLHHGDFVVEQLCMGLRSAHYTASGTNDGLHGFWMTDRGGGENSADSISWVKLGSALVGRHRRFAGSPHRVIFSIQEDKGGHKAAAVRAWRTYGQDEEFDPEELDFDLLSRQVVGFNCRTSYEEVDDEPEWLDEWEETNKLPKLVEIALYMEPLGEGEAPVEIKRVVKIPVAARSWDK